MPFDQKPQGSGVKSVTSDPWRITTVYTRFVKSAKVMLGVLVVTLTAVMFLYPVIKKNSEVRIAFTSTEKTEKPPPTQMVNANFHGFDNNNQPYNITAKKAVQIDNDNIVFDQINGDITLNNGVWLSVRAQKGSLEVKEHLLDLRGSVEMFNDQGYELHTDYIDIDIGNKIAITNQPVNGQGPLGILKSHGAVFDGTANTTTFKGPVFVTIYLPPKAKTHKQ